MSDIKFQHGGDTFVITFKHRFQKVHRVVGHSGTDAIVEITDNKTKYPYVTADIFKEIQPPAVVEGTVISPGKYEPFRTGTVGCWHREDPRMLSKVGLYEGGRKRALARAVATHGTETVSRDFRAAMWKAYLGRQGSKVRFTPPSNRPKHPVKNA